MKRLCLALVLLMALCVAGNAFASSEIDVKALMAAGDAAKEAGNYAEAIASYEKAASAGDTNAMNKAGHMYEVDTFGMRDDAKAAQWYQKSADLGSVSAMYMMGHMYHASQHNMLDYAKAAQWYGKAADAGYVKAMYWLGEMYRHEMYGMQDYAKAAAYFEKGAEAGNADAMYWLAMMYHDEKYGMRDPVQAANWSVRAADAGNVSAYAWAGYYSANPAEGKPDYAIARRYYELGAINNDAYCMEQLGRMYQEGKFGEPDRILAEAWFNKAIQTGRETTQELLDALLQQ